VEPCAKMFLSGKSPSAKMIQFIASFPAKRDPTPATKNLEMCRVH